MAKEEKKEKVSQETEVSSRELLKVIHKQQDQIASTTEELKKVKEAHNRLVDAFSELGDKLEKGGGAGKGGGLAEIATILKAVSPLLRGREGSPFEAIGVYTFKQFLRSSMGAKMGKKAIKEMFKEEKEEREEEEE